MKRASLALGLVVVGGVLLWVGGGLAATIGLVAMLSGALLLISAMLMSTSPAWRRTPLTGPGASHPPGRRRP